MHQSTLHLSCRYNSISYIAEIFISSQDKLKINRYYSNWCNTIYSKIFVSYVLLYSVLIVFIFGNMTCICTPKKGVRHHGWDMPRPAMAAYM